MTNNLAPVALLIPLLAAAPGLAQAQTFETFGIRAQGMGGAFVAVSDDATATWWNPAGLATGGFFDSVVQNGSTTEPDDHPAQGPAWRGDHTGVALAYPALGLSYYRLTVSEITPGPGANLRHFALSQYGATAGQTLAPGLVLASTLKLVRAGRISGTSSDGGDSPMDQARDLDPSIETEFGLDVGVMAAIGRLRIGGTLKNLRQPTFGDGDDEFRLERQARVGLAVFSGRFGPFDTLTAAVDADLTRTDTVHGERRYVAVGGETWLFARRVGLRGGLATNTVGESVTAKSAGLSLAAQRNVFVDGSLTFGSDSARGAWGVGLRVTY